MYPDCLKPSASNSVTSVTKGFVPIGLKNRIFLLPNEVNVLDPIPPVISMISISMYNDIQEQFNKCKWARKYRSGEGERSLSQNLDKWYINYIIFNISWIYSKDVTGFTNIRYFSSTPILCKDIPKKSFPIPPTVSSYVGY